MPRREPYFEDKSLVGYWKFDEGGGSTAYDSSRYRNNGTIIGATYSSAWRGLRLDGTDDYVDAGNDASLNIINNIITISAWAKISNIPGEQNLVIKTDPGIGTGYSLSYGSSLPQKMDFIKRGIIALTDTNTMTDTNWHYWVGVADSAGMYLYKDGVLASSNANTNNILGNTNNLRIGSRPDGFFFNGTIDEVRIWNRALSVDEIKELYNEGKWRI